MVRSPNTGRTPITPPAMGRRHVQKSSQTTPPTTRHHRPFDLKCTVGTNHLCRRSNRIDQPANSGLDQFQLLLRFLWANRLQW